ncbi:hypothetical protein CC78DRAFT_532010 [Lojkania enalia]|uniref:Uncharacterized protein n=1 Tax=Lojkania enalia TaxID=147567 RepID=A0A9P4N8P8_9PLEO|nr:hypothetical protein CC78DRAFT_532010 [Didymosphaeria enalia]
MALFAYHTYSKKLARALVFFLDENHSDIVTNEPTRYYNEWLEALRHLDGLVVPPTQLAKCKNYFLQRRGHFLEWDPLFERGRRTSRSLVQCEPRALTVPPIRHRSRPFYLPAPSMSPIIRSPSADDAYVGGALEEIADGVSYIGHKMDYVQQDVDNIKMILDGTIY